ncbi:hypothetical protein BU16DRAFT_461131 [Lophium mytilinum]|uniref:Vacuolar segregation subunit 7 n=1 Tax=Lophium mytilinum TaxID=390894 RepID=A0A6A6QSC9_9PEZI|nr:hypothetical protein BU16DRAFT_461131 [Lophium mytilinum]
MQSAEPPTVADDTPGAASASSSQTPSTTPEGGSYAQMRSQVLAGSRSLNLSASPSTANSPLSSRDSSPARPPLRPGATTGAIAKSGLRSRKSSTDVSPNRGASFAGSGNTVPSAAAIQRALSTANTPQLPPIAVPDPSRVPRPQKPASGTNSGETTPHWPVSPRLKSPPPTTDSRSRSRRDSLRTQPRKADSSTAPAIVVQSSSPAPSSRIPAKHEGITLDAEEQAQPAMKGSARGASGTAPMLETVQEGSLPTTPAFDGLEPQTQSSIHGSHSAKFSDDDRSQPASTKVTEDLSLRTGKAESGSDSGPNRVEKRGRTLDQRVTSTQKAATLPSKTSYSSLRANPPRSVPDIPSKNMTVETETVPSIPQAVLGANQGERVASGRDASGSLRLKASNETIRPKPTKKKASRKAPSINSGTGMSSRAHNFHHHHHPSVSLDHRPRSHAAASFSGSPMAHEKSPSRATSTSSSPEMVARRPSLRASSFTPSFVYFYTYTNASTRKASSKADVFEAKVASAVDEANSSDSDETFVYESNPDSQPLRSRNHHSRTPSMTSIASLADPRSVVRESNKVVGKRSMKFANNPYNNGSPDHDGNDRPEGTMRSGMSRPSGGSSIHHHHIGRHGQPRGGGHHTSLFDHDSPFPQNAKSRIMSSRQSSRPTSPRFPNYNLRTNGNGNGTKKNGEYSAYDIDGEGAADDERTPLVGSIRGPRNRPVRRPATGSIRGIDPFDRHHRSGGWFRRFAGCLVLSILLLVLIFGAVGLIFATTKPLYGVGVREVQNVIASEQEIIMDLLIEAVNPNIIGVTVADMDVVVFAKSKHVTSEKWWREHGPQPSPVDEDDDILDILPPKAVPGPLKRETVTQQLHTSGGVDEGTDPIPDDDEGDSSPMVLGRIFHFDSPLNFDGSFIKRHPHYSLGEFRISKPGNKTEAGGTERWEKILQYPFELIVRGVLKYQLPLSTRDHTVPITGKYMYDPSKEKATGAVATQIDHGHIMEDTHNPNTPIWGRWDARRRPFHTRLT